MRSAFGSSTFAQTLSSNRVLVAAPVVTTETSLIPMEPRMISAGILFPLWTARFDTLGIQWVKDCTEQRSTIAQNDGALLILPNACKIQIRNPIKPSALRADRREQVKRNRSREPVRTAASHFALIRTCGNMLTANPNGSSAPGLKQESKSKRVAHQVGPNSSITSFKSENLREHGHSKQAFSSRG